MNGMDDEELTAEEFDRRLESARPVTLNVQLQGPPEHQGLFYTVAVGHPRATNDSPMPANTRERVGGRRQPVALNQ